jgi:hypothetical protein
MVAGLLRARAEQDLKPVPLGPPNRDPDEDLRQLATHIREVVVDNNSALSSVGLVDWTSVYHVDELFEGGDRDLDPFVALADLNAIIAAVLFYDRVVVLDADDLVPRVAEALRVPDVLVSLSSKAGPSGAGGHSLLTWALEDCFQMSAARLSNLRPDGFEGWFWNELRRGWTDMLPGVALPDEYDLNEVGWSGSPGRPALMRQLFSPNVWKPSVFTKQLIIDNDVRALTYENVAALLTAALAASDLRAPTSVTSAVFCAHRCSEQCAPLGGAPGTTKERCQPRWRSIPGGGVVTPTRLRLRHSRSGSRPSWTSAGRGRTFETRSADGARGPPVCARPAPRSSKLCSTATSAASSRTRMQWLARWTGSRRQTSRPASRRPLKAPFNLRSL